jgi:hypothetical protein
MVISWILCASECAEAVEAMEHPASNMTAGVRGEDPLGEMGDWEEM